MKYGVIVITRDRKDMLYKTLPAWLEQDIPITLLTEVNQAADLRGFLKEEDWDEFINVRSHKKPNMGVGYARASATTLAHNLGYKAYVLADDDTKPTRGDVRDILDFCAKKRGIVCAGWMSNYGLWIPDGNKIGKQDGLVIPRPAAHDRIMAINTELCLRAGNFNPKLRVYHDTSEINRRGIKIGHLWYIHSSFHIAMVNKPKDPGGIAAHAGTAEKRAELEKEAHRIVYKEWGERYVSHPSKKYMCRWPNMLTDFIGPKAAAAVKEIRVYEATKVKSARRMFA